MYCSACEDERNVMWHFKQRELISNPRSSPFDSSRSYRVPAGERRKSLLCLSGTTERTSTESSSSWCFINIYLLSPPSHSLNSSVPVNLSTRTANNEDTRCSHGAYRTCDLLQSPNTRRCHPFMPRHLVTIPFRTLWVVRLLLSRPHCQIAFVPSVTLMYEKFKMSAV